MLAERLEFFVPVVSGKVSAIEAVIFFIVLSLALISMQLLQFESITSFIVAFLIKLIGVAITITLSFYVVELQRETLKTLMLPSAGMRIIATVTGIAALSMLLILFGVRASGLFGFSLTGFGVAEIFMSTLEHVLSMVGVTLLILMYWLRQHRQLVRLQLTVEQTLRRQNAHVKARLAPHFLFNTINSLTSLIETNEQEAVELLQHLTHLFRASFSLPVEINFEEEVELCQHYLAIESYRLADRLTVHWTLPDEELMYDMTITALTLQTVLEQAILHVVELSNQPVRLDIEVQWINHQVVINVLVKGQDHNAFLTQNEISQIKPALIFEPQQQRLASHFGKSALIQSQINYQSVVFSISYPLHDPMLQS